MTSRSLHRLGLVILTSGCVDTLSADVFLSDAAFVSALPHPEDQQLSVARRTGLTRRGPPPPPDSRHLDLLALSLDVATLINSLSGNCIALVDATAATPPSVREPDRREWGPVVYDATRVHLVVDRFPGAYTWDFRAGAARQYGPSELPSLCAGEADASTSQLADGVGRFDIDLAAWADNDGTQGTLETTFDLRDTRELRVVLDGVAGPGEVAQDGGYYFREDPGGGGDFQYRTGIILDDGEPATLEVRTRWTASGQGRADALVYADSLDDRYAWVQCFDQSGRSVYRFSEIWPAATQGVETSCVFGTAAEVDEI